MCVLGVDPGLSRCGYGVLRGRWAAPELLAAGVITSDFKAPTPQRLAGLQRELEAIFEEFEPRAVAVERVLFQANARTAMAVGQASGIALAIASRKGCEVIQLSPNEVKQAVAGYGSADKQQVKRMVAMRLGCDTEGWPFDAADAVALALSFLAREPLARALEEVQR